MHHLVHALLIDVKIDAFPRVQQDFAFLVAVGEHIVTAPFMKIARHARESFVRERQRQLRRYECLALLQVIFGIVLVDARKEIVILCVVGDHLQTVVARIAQCGTDDLSCVLLCLAVQREHHLRVARMRVARAVLVHYLLLSGRQRFLHQPCLVGPRTVEARHPYVAPADGNHSRGKCCQRHRLLLGVGHLRPHLDDVLGRVGFVVQLHHCAIHGVLHRDAHRAVRLFPTVADHCRRHVAVAVLHSQCGLGGTVHAIHGIGVHPTVAGSLQMLQFLRIQSQSVIHILGLSALLYVQYQRRVLCLYNHLCGVARRSRQRHQGQCH